MDDKAVIEALFATNDHALYAIGPSLPVRRS